MIDYVESPIDKIVEVGWPSEGGVARFTDAGTFGPPTFPTGLYGTISTSCSLLNRGATGITDGSSVRSFNFLSFAAIDPDFDNTRTHSQWLNATFTGQTSGATFRLADYAFTARCTTGSAPYDDQLYGDGSTHVWASDGAVSYGYVGKTELRTILSRVSVLVTDGLGGNHSVIAGWIDQELADVTF